MWGGRGSDSRLLWCFEHSHSNEPLFTRVCRIKERLSDTCKTLSVPPHVTNTHGRNQKARKIEAFLKGVWRAAPTAEAVERRSTRSGSGLVATVNCEMCLQRHIGFPFADVAASFCTFAKQDVEAEQLCGWLLRVCFMFCCFVLSIALL